MLSITLPMIPPVFAQISIPGLPEIIALFLDLFKVVKEYAEVGHYDSLGRQLYIEEGYVIVTISRVYIGNGYSAAESEYFVFDHNMVIVYNDVVKISYFID